VRFVVFCDDQAAARLFIKAMHDSRPFLPADSGKFWEMMEQRIHQRVLAVTRARMNDQPRRFVDYDQILVFIKNVERDRFRSIVDLFRRWFVYFNSVAAAHEIARAGWGAIEGDELFPHQLLKARSRISWQLARQKLIETKPCCFFRHEQFDGCRFFCHAASVVTVDRSVARHIVDVAIRG